MTLATGTDVSVRYVDTQRRNTRVPTQNQLAVVTDTAAGWLDAKRFPNAQWQGDPQWVVDLLKTDNAQYVLYSAPVLLQCLLSCTHSTCQAVQRERPGQSLCGTVRPAVLLCAVVTRPGLGAVPHVSGIRRQQV